MKQIAEKLRNRIFWALDSIKGGKLKAHYSDIERIMTNFNKVESKKRREHFLKKILRHACSTTSFYEEYKHCKNLNEFPVIEKAIIRDNFEAFQSNVYKDRPKHKVTTSGSSGTPFQVYQNIDKVTRNRADTIYFQKIAGYKIGYRLYYIRKWLAKYRMNKMTSSQRNIKMVNVADFSDGYLEKLIKTLRNDTSTTTLLSYSSALRDICQYLEKNNAKPIEANVTSIIAMAEGLGDDTREKLKKFFNAPVYLRYSNQENGILALQLSQNSTNLQINWASYFIEILHPEKDIPVNEGELGRVVITDLFNYCMPFIRYDTGDFAITTKENAYFVGSTVFKRIEGRKMDILYDTAGNVKSGFNIHHLESYPEIKQFQFVQKGVKGYLMKLAVRNRLNSRDEKKIITYFKNLLGADAMIEIMYVEEIPQLESGKRRLIINKYKK